STALAQPASRFSRWLRNFALALAMVCWHLAAALAPALPGGLSAACAAPSANTAVTTIAYEEMVRRGGMASFLAMGASTRCAHMQMQVNESDAACRDRPASRKVGGRDDHVDQSPCLGGRGVDTRPAEREVGRALTPDPARHAYGAAGAGN